MKETQRYLKLVGALLLLLSITLPLSSCEEQVKKNGHQIQSGEPHNPSATAATETVKTYRYIYEMFDPEEIAQWCILSGFLWPSIMVVTLPRLRKSWSRVLGRIAELLLTAWTVYVMQAATLLSSSLEIGAYVAFTGLSVYGIGAIWVDVDAFRQWKANRHN